MIITKQLTSLILGLLLVFFQTGCQQTVEENRSATVQAIVTTEPTATIVEVVEGEEDAAAIDNTHEATISYAVTHAEDGSDIAVISTPTPKEGIWEYTTIPISVLMAVAEDLGIPEPTGIEVEELENGDIVVYGITTDEDGKSQRVMKKVMSVGEEVVSGEGWEVMEALTIFKWGDELPSINTDNTIKTENLDGSVDLLITNLDEQGNQIETIIHIPAPISVENEFGDMVDIEDITLLITLQTAQVNKFPNVTYKGPGGVVAYFDKKTGEILPKYKTTFRREAAIGEGLPISGPWAGDLGYQDSFEISGAVHLTIVGITGQVTRIWNELMTPHNRPNDVLFLHIPDGEFAKVPMFTIQGSNGEILTIATMGHLDHATVPPQNQVNQGIILTNLSEGKPSIRSYPAKSFLSNLQITEALETSVIVQVGLYSPSEKPEFPANDMPYGPWNWARDDYYSTKNSSAYGQKQQILTDIMSGEPDVDGSHNRFSPYTLVIVSP